jgi:ribosome-associated protein
MRNSDIQALQEALALQDAEARQITVRHHRVEAWRDHLLVQGDEALGKLVPHVDKPSLQKLRNLLRNARKEADLQKAPAAARKIFKLLREIDQESNLPALTGN